jgi:group I intron endonuclease
MEVGKIYKISNNFDEQLYIGQTWRDLEKRWKRHCMPGSGCLKLRNSIQAHGKENFKIEVIWEGGCTQEELDKKEVEFISLFKTLSPFGYNLQEGGRGGSHSGETREKMSEARKGEKHPMFGKKHTEESIQKMRESKKGQKPCIGEKHHMFGKNHTEETRQKLSEALKGRKQSEETIAKQNEAKSKSVRQISLDGVLISVFDSMKQAAETLGIHKTAISACCRGKQKTTGGFKWEYDA